MALKLLKLTVILTACLALYTALFCDVRETLGKLEGAYQYVVFGPNSLCESGWRCDAVGDVTRQGIVRQ